MLLPQLNLMKHLGDIINLLRSPVYWKDYMGLHYDFELKKQSEIFDLA